MLKRVRTLCTQTQTRLAQVSKETNVTGASDIAKKQVEKREGPLPVIKFNDLKPRERQVFSNVEGFAQGARKVTLGNSPEAALARKMLPYRTGLLAIKRSMMPFYDELTESRVAATLLQVDRCQVITTKTVATHGYSAVQIGAGIRNPRSLNKAELGHFAKANCPAKAKVIEMRIHPSREFELPIPGQDLKVNQFKRGQMVDVIGTTKGKGFAGVMKRHGFHGMPATHGTSVTHRAGGSMGSCQDPGRVLPGKKMAGRMGGQQQTIHNLEVLQVDPIHNLILVKGAVPGPKYGFVAIRDAIFERSLKGPYNADLLAKRTAARAARLRSEQKQQPATATA